MNSFTTRLGCLFLLMAVSPSSVATADEQPTAIDLFEGGQEGYFAFRIPALMTTAKGTVLAFCEGRKTSLADLGDNDMLLKRSVDGGRTWGPLQLVYEEGGDKIISIGNPTPVQDRQTGRIWLIFARNSLDILTVHSDDEGKTWSKPTNLTPHVKKPGWEFYVVGPGVGIQLQNGPHKGRLVIPAYHRKTRNKRDPSFVNMIISDDHGKSWRSGGDFGIHVNECQVVETPDGGLLVNGRNHWARSGGKPKMAKVRIVGRSTDGGTIWSEPKLDKTLIEPTCQAALIRYSFADEGKSRLLFSNPASKTSRSTMTVRMSYDDGKTWPIKKLIYAPSSAYSTLTRLPDGRVGMIYERDGYKRLAFTTFSISWLSDGKDKEKGKSEEVR